MRKFIVLSIILLMLAGFAITSSATPLALLAGKNINVGTLNVEVVGDNLVVTYTIIASGWVLGDTHLYVGTVVPTKSAPGQFPYGPDDAVGGVYTIVYTIPLTDFMTNSELPTVLYIAAHAVVTNTCESREETAWAGWCNSERIRPNKNWATYFTFSL